MNTTQLECFTTLANTLNYAKAAEQLGFTQPAITKQLQTLEKEMGSQLFFRTTRSVSLTQVGERFLPEAKQMLTEYYHAKQWISEFQSSQKRKFRIGYGDSYCLEDLGIIMKYVMQKSDGIVPEFVYDQTDANLERLQHGLLDVIIGMRDSRFSDETITFHKLRDEKFVCVMAKDADFAKSFIRKKTVSTENLFSLPQVLLIPSYLLKNYFSKRRYIVPINDSVTNILAQNAAEACALVQAGAGYAMIPRYLLPKHHSFKILEWQDSPSAPFGIYHQKGKKTDSDLSLFIGSAKNLYIDGIKE
jgi:DNA-binding transcriptional LysR family regulator